LWAGQITVIVGPSGSGKTTLLRTINRLNECFPDCRTEGAARLRLDGRCGDIYQGFLPLPELRRRVGMVFQTPAVLPFSIKKNLTMPLRVTLGMTGVALAERVERALREVTLWDEVKDRLHDAAATLSGGQQQRLCLARVLALEPQILLLEEQTGQRIEAHELNRQIKLQNEVRRLLWRISRYSAAETIPLSGLDMMTVMETKSSCCDLEAYATLLRQLIEVLDVRSAAGVSVQRRGGPRLLLTGCPVGKGLEKVLRLIEECGGMIVSLENCTGIKGQDLLVEEDTADPLEALARRYLQTPCSCMTPNQGRLHLLQRLVEEFHVQGVVDLTWQCCHTYNVESFGIKQFLEKRHDLPFLHLETDYSASDTEQLRTRIEAFLEMIT
jgi:ABC-type lipoprotein export system ATPase subunit